MKLRPYQKRALAKSKERLSAGVNRQLIALPTGTGKTCIFSALREHHGFTGKILVLVNREELAEQAKDKLQIWNPTLKVGVEMATHVSDNSDDIVVGSVPTLGRTNSARLAKFNPDEYSCVVCDEAHHSTADSYTRIFHHFGFMGTPDKPHSRLLLGVTATPNRGDGEPLVKVYDEIVDQMPLLEAIEQGWLCDIRGMAIYTDTNISKVATRAGDFAVNDLADAVNNYRRNELAVRKWQEVASDRQTVVFAVDVAHAKALADVFTHKGIAACAIWADDPDRAAKLSLFKQNKLPVLVNVGILTEGFDYWGVKCILLARPTQSGLLYTQMIGRGTRLQEGIDNLIEARMAGVSITKPDCLIIDMVDNSTRHRLQMLPTLFGLPHKLNLKGERVTKTITKVNEVAAAHPDLDLDQLESMDKLEGMIKALDLFKVTWPKEVLAYSSLQWHRLPSGAWMINIPSEKREDVTIWQDLLDHWHVTGSVNGNKFESATDNLEQGFMYAEQMIHTFGKQYITLLRRDGAKWHEDKITASQRMYLKRLLGKEPPANMSKGAASVLINKALADREATQRG